MIDRKINPNNHGEINEKKETVSRPRLVPKNRLGFFNPLKLVESSIPNLLSISLRPLKGFKLSYGPARNFGPDGQALRSQSFHQEPVAIRPRI
jgi:hypothetical protein